MNFLEILKFNKTESEEIANILLEENSNTIIAQIGKKFIVNIFLKKCMCSKYINIFVVKKSDKIIGYSILAKKQSFFNHEFSKYKFKIILSLILKLNFFQLINLILIFINFDSIIFDKQNIEKVKNSINLTYLAIHKNYRNEKIGRKFLEFIFSFYEKNSLITVETDNKKTLNFYTKYLNFRVIGIRRRLPKKLFLLIRKETN